MQRRSPDQNRPAPHRRNLPFWRSAPVPTTERLVAAATTDHAPRSGHVRTAGFRPIEQPEKPPFDFRADLLLVMALVPAEPIYAAFPDAALLTAGGSAPLLAWFSRVRESCYRDASGSVICTRADGQGAYAELTLLLIRRDGQFFVPHIEASSVLSQRLARAYYGMPKMVVPAVFGQDGARLIACVERSRLEGHRIGGRMLLAAVAHAILPRWGRWRAHFPGGGSVRTRLTWVERVECVRIREARLAPHPPWLPCPATPFGLGVLLRTPACACCRPKWWRW